MNKIFKVVWSKTKECYVVVSEVAKNNGGKKKVLASVLAGLAMVGAGAIGTPVQAGYSDSGSSINIWPNAKTGNYVGSNAVVVGFENKTDADIPGTDQLGRVIYGTGNIGAGNSALAVGNNNEARGTAVVAIGHGANAKAKQSVALGNVARAEKDGTVAIGTYVNAETTNVGTATVPKYNTKETGAYSTAVGAFSWTKGDYSAAYGYQAEATGTNAVAIGRVSKATGTSATAVGVNNKAQAQDSSAVGSSNTIDDIATQSSAFGRENTVNRDGSIAAGYKNTAVGQRNVAIGNQNTTAGEETIGIGTKVIAGTGKTIAIGGVYNPGGGVEKQTIARGNDTINAATGQVNNIFALAIGNGAQADGKAKSASGMIAIGQDVTADNNNTVAIGVQTKATGNNALAVGSTAQAIGTSSAAFGTQAVANGTGATAFGPGSSAGTGAVTADGSVAVGRKATVTAAGGVGIGWTASASEKNATAIGFSATASGVQSVAIGGGDEYDYPGTERGKHFTTASGKSSVAVGSYAKATEENAMAFGTDANANIAGGVALGSESKTTTAAGVQGYNPASDRTNKYSTQGGAVGTSTLAAVSIGDGSAKTRQLTGLAAGTADTDAVNVAQLKNVNLKYAGDTGNSDVLLKDGTLKVKGDNNFISTSADGTGITVTAKIGNPITANAAGKAEAPATNGLATTTNVADAINASGWNVVSSNNGGSVTGTQATKLVNPGSKVTLSAGKNIVLDQNDKQFTYSLNKDVDLTKDGSLTIGDTKINNAGMTITGGPSITKTGIDAGSKKITNVTAGTADTDAVNVKQLKDTEKHIKPDTYAVANDGSVTLKYVDGNGAEQTETAKITGIAKKSKVINGQNTTVEEGTDTTDNSVTYKVNVKGDLADISSITNGTGSGKISFEGDQVVKVGGDHPISFDGKGGYVTGLQNKDWDITNPTVVSGRAATEDQLKKVSDGFNNTVKLTGNSGATGTQKLNQNGGLSFGVVGADNGKYITTTASGSNVVADLSTDAKNKLNSKVVVTGSGAATVAAPTVTTNPDGSTVTTYTVHVDPATATAASTESVVKKAVTGDTNIADVSVADGKATGDVGAKYEVSVSRNAVKDAAREAVTVNNGGTTTGGTYTADTNNPISVTAKPDNTNHNTTYEVTFDGNKAAKQIPLTYKATNGTITTADQTVKLDKGLNFTGGDYTTASVGADGKVTFDVTLGTTPTVTDGKPGVPGQAGAAGKDGIATVKTVVDTINNSGWKANAKANGGTLVGNSTATVVKPGDQVNFAAGKNLTVKQDLTGEHTYTYSLNKDVDLTNAGSLTVGDTKVNNDGITIKAPTPAAGTTPTTDVKLTNTGLDNGGNKIVNVAEGTADTDAVNVKQLKDAKTVLADGKNTKKSGTGTAADPYKVNVEGDLTGISSITNDGTNNGKISFGPNKTVTVDGDHSITLNASTGKIGGLQNLTFDPTNFTSGQAATEDQLKSVHDTLKANERHIAPTTVATGSTENKGGTTVGTENIYKYDATTKKVTLTYNDGNGHAVTDTKAVIDFSALNTGGTTASTWTAKTSAENTTAGSEVGKHAGDTSQVIGNQNSVDFQAGKNMTVKQTNDGNGNTTINYALDKNLDVESVHVGKDGKDGKIGIDGKDGVDGLDGTNRVDIHVEKGAKGVDGTDGHDGVNGHNGKDGMTRIVYEDKGGKQEVATLNDGMKYAGDDAQGTDKTKVIAKKLNETLDIIGGANKADLTTDNIGVNNDGNGKLLVQLSKKLKGLDSVQTKTVELGDHTTSGGTTNITYNAGDKRIEYTTPGATPGTTDTKKVATTDDIWTIQGNGTDVAPVNGKVNVKAGENILITTPTTADGSMTINAVTPAVYTDKNGNKLTKDKDGKFHKPDGTEVAAADVITSIQDAAGNVTGGNSIVNNVGSAIKNAGNAGDSFLTKLDAANTATPNAAVNVSDLKNTADGLTDKGLKFNANEGGVKTNKLGSTVTVQGSGALTAGKAYADEYNTANIRTNIEQGTDGNTTINVGLAKELKDINSISNGGSSITISNVPTGATTPAVTISGGNLSMGNGTTNNKIVNLAPGTGDNDAVNVKQLKDTELHITPGTYTPGADKKVKLTYTDGNNTVVNGKEAVIDLSGLATGGTTSTEKVQKAADATDDKNIAEVGPKSGDTFGAANATYEVSVSRNAVKDAAREAVTINNGGTKSGTTYTPNADNPITVTPKEDAANHNTTYEVTFDGNKAAKQIPLTYKATNGTITTADQTVKLDKGLNFTGGDYTTASVGADGKVTFDVTLGTTPTVTDGKPGVPGQAGAAGKDGIATVKTVVDTINNSGWKANAKANGGTLVGNSTATVVKPGDQVNFAAGKNLTVKQDLTGEHTYTYSLNKDVDLTNAGSLTVGDTKVNNDGITIKAPTPAAGTTPTTDVKLTNTGLDNGGNKIVNVAEGTADTDAVNVKQLKDAKTVLADGKNTKKSGTGTAADPYKVNVEGDLTGISSITNDGTNNGKISFGPNKTVTVDGDHSITLNASTGKIGGLQNLTFDPTNFTSGQAATEDQLKSVHDTLKANERHIAPTTVATGSTETKGGTANAGGTANVYKYDAASKTVTLTYNDGNGHAVTDTKAVIDFSALNTGGTTASTWTAKTSAENTTAGSEVGKHAGDTSQVIGNQNSVDFQAGKNMTVKQTNDGNGNTTINYALDKNLDVESVHVGKDGKDGKIGIDGKDGVDGLDGTNRVDIHVEKGAKGVDGTDGHDGVNGHNGKDGMTRIVYEDKGGKQEVATLNDGLKFTGNNESTVNNHKLNTLVKVQGEGTKESTVVDPATGKKYVVLSDGTTKFESAKDNIAVEADGTDTLTVKLNKNLKGLNSIQLGGNTIQSNGDNITFTTNGGTTKTVATTDQLWTIQANGTDVPATNGKVNVVGKDGITVAKNAAGNLEISGAGLGTMNGFDVTANNGATSKTIDNGKKVDFNAGSNLTVKQTNDATGTHIEYALKEAVDLGTNGSLKAGDTTVNKDGVTIANGPSITKTGVDAGDKKITNVADGAVNATSKDAVNGSQLKKYTDAAKTTVEAGDDNVKVETDNSAADGHTNYKVSLKPVVEIGDTHKVKIDGHTGDITGLTNVDLTDPTFATKGRAATEEQLNKVLTEAKKKAVEKVQAGTAAAGDTNIATVAPKAGDTFGAAGATYEVSVSKNAVKDAAKEAVKVTSASPAITVTPDTSVAHETTYKVGFDGDQAATQIPLTYKQNGGSARTVKLSDGLNFIDGTNTKARTAADGKVTFDVMGDLTGITSISNAAGGPKMTFGGNSINVTNGDLNMGGNKITNLGKGTATTDAATVGQLTKVTSNNHSVVINKTTDANGAPVYDLAVTGTPGAPAVDPRIDQLGEEIGRVGAQGAALSALKPIQYDPLEPTQIMAGYGNYRGNSAVALGVAHYKNESTLIHGGVSWAGGSSHMMANAGVTWKVGNRDSEAAVADRYRKGPISSAYAMQQEMAAMKAQNAGLKGEVSDLKAENEQMKAQIAAMMAKLGL
ncbi:ESPR-type extended signal peptide-containing protein [Veillonella atypica]|uniref:ESPR-type extended signal peptide-containing protein n=1 Tax=Veillonella atypica TaxID=39777 RepID=UPI003995BD82